MAIKIDQKIVGWEIREGEVGKPQVQQPLLADRPRSVEGRTYKISAPGAYSSSIYVTVNDIDTPYGRRPFEIFIMSRVQESYQWITLVTRLTSAVMRQNALLPKYDPFFVQEFLVTFDPGKQYFSTHYKGRYMNSVVQEIGMVLQEHMAGLGLMTPPSSKAPPLQPSPDCQVANNLESDDPDPSEETQSEVGTPPSNFEPCPECGSANVQMLDGCLTCLDCGYSKCG